MSQDNQLQQAVTRELNWEPSINAAHIGVTARAGVVTLSGHVERYAEKHAAETAAGRVKGVKAVAEEIEVRLPFETKRSDDEIAAAAVDRLAWTTSDIRDAVKVRVEKGWVTLTGEVDWHFQATEAEHDVRRLWGVVGVSNQITIKAKVDTADIADGIRVALHRSWLDPDTIEVSAVGGRVLLSGTVHSLHDRDLALWAAWASPGATSVQNDIAVV